MNNVENYFYIGGGYNSLTDTSFNGKISEFRIFDTALSTNDISQLYGEIEISANPLSVYTIQSNIEIL